MNNNIAIFPGSFDPVTIGHQHIVLRALPMFSKIIVAVGDNTAKKCFFPLEKRILWLKETFKGIDKIEIDTFSCLTVDYCKKRGAKFIVRGIRNSMDFIYEMNIVNTNNALDSEIETVFLPTKPGDTAISSSFVREILSFGGDVSRFIPKEININA